VALSADGRFAAYYSFDGEITADDPDPCTEGDWSHSCEDLFIYDRQNGQIERIPVGRSSGLGKSYGVALSADGHYVAYDNGQSLAVYDRQMEQPINIFSEPPNGETFSPAFAANGDLAFVSRASNLVPNDTNETYDVFVWDSATGQISRVSVTSDSGQSDDVSGALSFHEGVGESLAISGDGRFIAFSSQATSLTAESLSQCVDYLLGQTRICYNIYLHDRETDQTRLMTNGNGDSIQPDLSADGTFLVFTSGASNLLPDSPSCEVLAPVACGQIYLMNTQTGELRGISQTLAGEWGSSGSLQPDISADGRFIAFASGASNLLAGDTNGVSDIFIFDQKNKALSLVSLTAGP
jgi:Tol biopolymer transport system component